VCGRGERHLCRDGAKGEEVAGEFDDVFVGKAGGSIGYWLLKIGYCLLFGKYQQNNQQDLSRLHVVILSQQNPARKCSYVPNFPLAVLILAPKIAISCSFSFSIRSNSLWIR
jgi:hypothetical protein